MAKISKPVLKLHNKAVELLKKESLDHNEREFIFMNYHEGAGKMNNLISAHFTPYELARHLNMCITQTHFVDLCAGIGMLSYSILRNYEMGSMNNQKPFGICVENCTEYFEVGKKLLPEFHWINGDIFDPKVIEEIKALMKGKNFSIVSNPPYGKQVKTETKEILKYSGATFEYKAIELGAILGAYDGAFLLPQNSCPFRLSGRESKQVHSEAYKTPDYLKFHKNTGLEIQPNMGICTQSVISDSNGWKDVSVMTEIAEINYDESNYKPIHQTQREKATAQAQTTLF